MPELNKWAISLMLAASIGAPALRADDPLAPAHGINEWVAGAGIGTEDGAFDQARFKDIAGLVYDPVGDRLLVADRGTSSIRTIALGQLNRVGTLGHGDALDLAQMGMVSPTALAWIDPGVTVAVLDPGRPALSIVDLRQQRVVACLTATAATQPALNSFLAHGTDILAVSGGLLVSSGGSSQLGLLSLTAQGLTLRRAWAVGGFKGVPGIDAVTQFNGQILAIRHSVPDSQYFDVRDERNAYPGTRFGGDDSQLPVSLTATLLNLGDLKEPWAFLKGADPLDLVTRSPYLCARVIPQQPICQVWKQGVYDRDGRIIGVNDDQIFDKDNHSIYTDPTARGRYWLRDVAAAACDVRTNTWYFSDPENGRVLSYRPIEDENRYFEAGNLKGFAEWNYPVTRRPEVRRVAVMNLSRMMLAADTNRIDQAFSKRLEHHLNMMSALGGSDEGYEVLFIGSPWSWEPDGMSSLGQLRDKWPRVMAEVDPDELMLVMGPMDLYQTALDYRMRPARKDGLPELKFDTEFASDPNPADQLPEYLDICRYIKANHNLDKVFAFNRQGVLVAPLGLEPAALAFSTDPFLFKHSLDLIRHYLDDLQRKTQQKDARGKVMDVTILYYPDCNGLSHEESCFNAPTAVSEPLGAALRKECESRNWRFIDITSAMKLFAVDDPFMINFKLHPNARGHDDLAFITAWRMLHLKLGISPRDLGATGQKEHQ